MIKTKECRTVNNLKIMMLSHRPPPLHGAALMGEQVFSYLSNRSTEIRYLGLSSSNAINEVGNLNIRKTIFLSSLLIKLLRNLIRFRPNIIYLTPSVSGSAFYKDMIFIFIVKAYKLTKLNCRIIYHLHMRPHQAGSFRRNYLFKFMFRSTELILPSKTLIADYKNKVLKKTKVSIVPNIIDPIGSIKLAYSKANSYNSKTMGHKITNVLYFAHLIESKGYKRALDIAKSVVSRNTNYHFFFVGEMGSNSDKKYFEHFVFENKLQDYIQYYGSGVEEKDKC